MNTFTRPIALLLTLAAVVLVGTGHAQDKKPVDPKKPTVMKRKLAHAQLILEGLAMNDFDKMRKAAEELQLCAKEASWQVVKTPKYELYSNDFVRGLTSLQTAAKNKNTDAAALAYVEVTLTCVKCHQYVREERIGAAPNLSPLRTTPAGAE